MQGKFLESADLLAVRTDVGAEDVVAVAFGVEKESVFVVKVDAVDELSGDDLLYRLPTVGVNAIDSIASGGEESHSGCILGDAVGAVGTGGWMEESPAVGLTAALEAGAVILAVLIAVPPLRALVQLDAEGGTGWGWAIAVGAATDAAGGTRTALRLAAQGGAETIGAVGLVLASAAVVAAVAERAEREAMSGARTAPLLKWAVISAAVRLVRIVAAVVVVVAAELERLTALVATSEIPGSALGESAVVGFIGPILAVLGSIAAPGVLDALGSVFAAELVGEASGVVQAAETLVLVGEIAAVVASVAAGGVGPALTAVGAAKGRRGGGGAVEGSGAMSLVGGVPAVGDVVAALEGGDAARRIPAVSVALPLLRLTARVSCKSPLESPSALLCTSNASVLCFC